MINVKITDFQKNISNLLEQTLKYNQPIKISTKMGNAIIISEEYYNELLKTLCITNKKDYSNKDE